MTCSRFGVSQSSSILKELLTPSSVMSEVFRFEKGRKELQVLLFRLVSLKRLQLYSSSFMCHTVTDGLTG